ncbi:MAG: SDR family oxidoreductase [Flavobacteriales bacterium]
MTTSSPLRPDLTDKVVVVTGSSRGIGKAIAIACAQRGAAVVLNGRNQERLASAKAAVEEHTSRVHVVCGDVSDPKEGRRLIEEAVATFGRLDLLVNNVGVSMRGAVADLQPEVFQTVFASNVFGTVNPTIPAIPELRKTKGSIIFISSLAGIRGLPSLSAYCSSKMALRALAESIRIEEHAHGIHVGLIQVGITEIEHNKETIAADGSLQVLQDRAKGKVQTTEQVALAVLDNLRKRTFITTLTAIGKLNAFLQPRAPMLVERIILNSLDKFAEKSK